MMEIQSNISPYKTYVREFTALSGSNDWAVQIMDFICDTTISYKRRECARRELELRKSDREGKTSEYYMSYAQIANEVANRVNEEAEAFFKKQCDLARKMWICSGCYDDAAEGELIKYVKSMLPEETRKCIGSDIDNNLSI